MCKYPVKIIYYHSSNQHSLLEIKKPLILSWVREPNAENRQNFLRLPQNKQTFSRKKPNKLSKFQTEESKLVRLKETKEEMQKKEGNRKEKKKKLAYIEIIRNVVNFFLSFLRKPKPSSFYASNFNQSFLHPDPQNQTSLKWG